MIRFSTTLPSSGRGLVLALGVFDAVHLGHQELVGAAHRLAQTRGAATAAVTFFPHPKEVLSGAGPTLLLPMEERIFLLCEAGCDAVGTIDFSTEFSRLSPEDFCRALRDEKDFRLAGIAVGSRWRFGACGRGDAEFLKKFFAGYGIPVVAVNEKIFSGDVISASRIRDAISSGNLTDASAMLGRRVALYGRVVHGFGDATKLLDAPTINLELHAGILPPDGVYAARALLPGGKIFAAAVNIGVAPTFSGRGRRIEAHLLDFDGDLYGCDICIELLDFIRKEKKFSSVDELKKQIGDDLIFCRQRNAL